MPALIAALALLIWGLAPAAAQDFEDCALGAQPAATLLFPFFEVNTANSAGVTTLLSVANRSRLFPALAHAVVWTDWGLPIVAFDIYLEAGGVYTLNLRDLFTNGSVPASGPVPAGGFPGCAETLGGFLGIGAADLRATFTGRSVQGSCWASPRSNNVATGFVTVDTVRRCSDSNTHPATRGYFFGGRRGSEIATADNLLWGDFFLINPSQNFAQGETAVHVVADPDRFAAGDYTFYGKYVGFNGSDGRMPLSSEWRARFLVGGAFDGGTDLLVWRDTRDASLVPQPCGSSPAWFPLGEDEVMIWDEEGNAVQIADPAFFGLATQRANVGTRLDPPFNFGWLDLDLDHGDGTRAQAWVIWLASARGRFSVGQTGIRGDDLCGDSP